MPLGKAIFLSYASEDAGPARRVAEGLRAAGLDVWFDQSELRGGEAWDAMIRRRLKECALFVPIISANTEARSEGYFRLEWKLAVDRSHLMADDQAFVVPVVIDGTREAAARVPEAFHARQWTRLPGGEATAGFTEQVRKLLDSAAQVPAADPPRAAVSMPRRPGRGLVLAALALLAAATGAGWYFARLPHAEGPPLMSIAFTPFTAGGGAEAEAAARRISAEATAAFERTSRSAAVISHGLASATKERVSDPRQLGRELNVRYIVEGELRQEADARVLEARLIETARGTQAWSTRLNASAERPDWSQRLVAELVNGLRPVLYQVERKRVADMPAERREVMHIVLQADELLGRDASKQAREAGRRLYEQALAANPRSLPALQGLFWLELGDFYGPGADRERLLREMDDLTRRSVQADRRDVRAWRSRAILLSLQWRWDGAFEASAEALRIDPFHNSALGERAFLFILTGRAEEALPLLEHAMALDPRSPEMPSFLHFKCWAHLHLSQFDKAIEACEKGAALGGGWILNLRAAAAYAKKGDIARAKDARDRALKRSPPMSIAYLSSWKASDHPVFIAQREENLFNALRSIGIPER